MDPWEVAEAVPDAFTAPLPEIIEEAPAPEAPAAKSGGRPRKEPADAAEAARLERERERKRRTKDAKKSAAAPSSPTPKERAQEAKAAAEEAPPTFSAEVPADPGAGSMKLTKREAQAMLAQVFSLPAAMLEPQIFGCLLVPGKVATVKCTESTSIEVAIPEHLETTRKAAIEGLAILLDGQEIDPRYVAAGMVAVHAISVGAVYWQIADQMAKIRKEEAGEG
jgi:hypothetical protein